MTREEFIRNVTTQVEAYIKSPEIFDNNPQIRVNPDSKESFIINGRDMLSEIADSDEAVENAAIMENAADEEAMDYQVAQNPDFYTVKMLVEVDPNGKTVVDTKAISDIADTYF